MHVQFDAVLQITFRCGSVADGKQVVKTLGDIHKYIVREVVPP
jgi:hypothetical protein